MNPLKQISNILYDVAMSYVYEVKDHIPQSSIQQIGNIMKSFIGGTIGYDEASQSLLNYLDSASPLEKINSIMQCESSPVPDSPQIEVDDSTSRKKTRTWTSNEDQRLIFGVHKFGLENWNAVSQFVGFGRSRSQCSQRWLRVLDPRISKSPWAVEEESKLQQLVNRYGEKSWTRIAAEMGNRSDVQCRYHFRQLQGVSNIPGNAFSNTDRPIGLYNSLPRTNSTPPIPMSQPIQMSFDNRMNMPSLLPMRGYTIPTGATYTPVPGIVGIPQNTREHSVPPGLPMPPPPKPTPPNQNEQAENVTQKNIGIEAPIPLRGSYDIFKSDQLFSADWM